MKTRSAIIYISLLFLILVTISFFGFKKAIESKNKILLSNRYTELKKSTNTLLDINNRNFENFILENTYDVDLKKAITKDDTNWLISNFITNLSTYNVDCAWIIASDGKVIFSRDNDEASPLFPIDKNIFIDGVSENPYKNFYTNIDNQVIQLVTAPMELSESNNSKNGKIIFLVFGKKQDEAYLNNLSDISTGARFSVIRNGATLKDSINAKDNIINYQYSLTNFKGVKFGSLQSSKVLTEIAVYKEYFGKYSMIYLLLFLLLGLAYYKFLGVKVLKPISILSNALNNKDAAYLKNLKLKNDEFGHIATLLNNSFDNTQKLNSEIERRKISENELKESVENLEKITIEKVRAEQDKKAKGDFLSTMSHEIRTPINGVIGIANLLKTEDLNAAQLDLVDTLVFSSNYLLSILTDILDFSKIEAGNLTFDNVSFNIKEICKNIQALNQANAKNKNLLLMLNTDDDVPEYLEGDSLRLCQVINNLIGNAIKFTNNGHVTLDYSLLKSENDNISIQFKIIDSGIGIASDKLDTIFDSFSQADKTISTNYGGTGLGLTISKKLVKMQGGKIWVESEVNKGTTFTFILNFKKVNTAFHKTKKYERANVPLNLNGLKVLVAEDNNINATILHKFLQKWNVKMDLAVNGKEVLEKLEYNTYDLILMDLHMPLLGGKEATKIIRNNETALYKSIPIIALTADATSETKNMILSSGFDDYITKPFNPDKLYGVLENFALAEINYLQ